MKRLIKAGLMVLMGTVIWINGGMVEKAKAQECAPGGQVVSDPVYGSVCYYANGSCPSHLVGTSYIPPNCQPQPEQPANPKPIIQKPSSYGAVAWGNNYFGNASNQTSKQNAINAALQKCGESSCQVANWYSNQCVALASGINNKGAYTWQASNGLTQTKAQKAALKDCNKSAKNCKVVFSECSLP